ncbi:Uncharacterised protein [Vibrio cholerae]|nr:Uncharacterised protein [Vibrio cholerae]CSB72849.1 Uncharacterised protein [Vibrio cholerae]CSC83581.1 Uncharacterised protein [Vibrio cholerae]
MATFSKMNVVNSKMGSAATTVGLSRLTIPTMNFHMNCVLVYSDVVYL